MKINSIQRDITLKYGGSGARSSFREKNKNTGYNAEYCGSFTGKSEAAASFLDKILKSNWFGKFTEYSEKHNIATSALIALVLAGIMRPATIMALPGDKDKEDKIYASGHAIASGIIGFLFSTALTSPFDESINKVFDEKNEKSFAGKKLKQLNQEISELKKLKENGTISKAQKKLLKSKHFKRDAMKTLAKNIPDWIIAVPRAMLTIALIPPILKYVFGVEKKKKQAPVQAEQTSTPDFIEKPIFSNFKGGVQ